MTHSTLTTKGRVTIPKDVRKRLQLRSGDKIRFIEIEEGKFALVPENRDVTTLKGLIPEPARPVRIEDMARAIRRPSRKS